MMHGQRNIKLRAVVSIALIVLHLTMGKSP